MSRESESSRAELALHTKVPTAKPRCVPNKNNLSHLLLLHKALYVFPTERECTQLDFR